MAIRHDADDDATPDLSQYYAIHRQQRLDIARLVAALEQAGEGERNGRLRALARWAAGFARELDVHHTVEDDVLFPAALARAPELAPVFAELDEDHQVVEHILGRFGPAAGELVDPSVSFTAIRGELLDLAVSLRDLLTRHLDAEDAEVLPVFGTRFTRAEYDSLHDEALKTLPRQGLAFTVNWNVAALDEALRESVVRAAPVPLRLLYRATRGWYGRLVAAAFDGVGLGCKKRAMAPANNQEREGGKVRAVPGGRE